MTGEWVVRGPDRAGFAIADYDRTRPLVIDPVLEISTFVGGNEADSATDVRINSAGNLIVGGWTRSTDLPGSDGSDLTDDLLIFEVTPDLGPVLWITVLGGDHDETVTTLDLDAADRIHVAGITEPFDFPSVWR